jgi:DNA-binding transcriptional MerR regulator
MEYSIKYLETISGIKAHTIRIWEKRYKLLKPKRTDTNIRFYDDQDLKKILNVSTLLNAGYKISEVSRLDEKEMSEELKKCLIETEHGVNIESVLVNELIVSSLNFDKYQFEKTFSTGILKLGIQNTIENVLFPTLKKIGVLWQSEEINPAQEHFFSSLLKQKMFSAIDAIQEPENSNVKCILFLPEEEDHEIGLLYFNYLLLKGGAKTIYLGTRMPLINIIESEKSIKPTHVIFFIIKLLPFDEVENYVNEISKNLPNQTILFCGNPEYSSNINFPQNVKYISSPDEAKKFFKLKFNL